MSQSHTSFTKRKALSIVFLVAAVLLGLILFKSCSAGADASTLDGRESFLKDLGWEIDRESEDLRKVQLPTELEGMLADYNEMQLQQGFDLSRHLGETCMQYSYVVTNYPDKSQTVLVTLYVQGQRVIAGDIHSTAMNGFLHGLKMEEPAV